MELLKSESREIDGFTYEVTQLGAIKGSQVFVRVLRLLGPMVKTKDVGSLFANLQEEDVKYLCDAFAPRTQVMGVAPLDKCFDFHFAGRYMALVKWLVFCFELNFGDFLKGASLSDASQALGLTASQSTSQRVVTGASGAS